MRDRSFFFVFLAFLLVSLFIFFLSSSGFLAPVSSLFARGISPIRSALRITPQGNDTFLKKLSSDIDILKLKNENQALRDQFETKDVSSNALLPARVIGSPTFIPGVTLPEAFVIDKGSTDGVLEGMACVFQDNLVGVITETGDNSSVITLLTNSSFSTTVKLANGALGVIRGQGKGEMELDNVSASETIEKDEAVLTKGAVNGAGVGIMPDLVVGKITSIDKKPSELFQRAKVKSLLDFSSISYVFIILR